MHLFYPVLPFSLGKATPLSVLHSTSSVLAAGSVLTGHHPCITLTESLADIVIVEPLTRCNVVTLVAAAALSKRHTAILEGKSQSGQCHVVAVAAVPFVLFTTVYQCDSVL